MNDVKTQRLEIKDRNTMADLSWLKNTYHISNAVHWWNNT